MEKKKETMVQRERVQGGGFVSVTGGEKFPQKNREKKRCRKVPPVFART